MNLIVFEDNDNLRNIPNIDKYPIDTELILKINIKLKNFSKIVNNALKLGYKYPIITTKFLEDDLKTPYLFLYNKYNHNYGKYNKNYKNILKDVNFCIKNYISTKNISKNCKIFIVFDKNVIDYLHNYTKKYKFKFENNIEQREISGKFLLRPINDKTIKIEIDENSSGVGGKEDVYAMSTMGSFHTHPLEAYQKYNVCVAWPSVDDLFSFFMIYLDGYGIFHTVSTIEGIYIISISDEIMTQNKKDFEKDIEKIHKYIKNNYFFNYPECKISSNSRKNIWREKISEYIEKVNKLKYFKIQFFEWKDADKLIEINYKRDNGNCLICDEQVRFNKLYMI